jgi:hypothetical protein
VDLTESAISVRPLMMQHVFSTPEQFGESILEEYKVQLIVQVRFGNANTSDCCAMTFCFTFFFFSFHYVDGFHFFRFVSEVQALRLIGGKVVSAVVSSTETVLFSPLLAARMVTGTKKKVGLFFFFDVASHVQKPQQGTNQEEASQATGIATLFAKKKQMRKRTPRYFDSHGTLVV